MTELEEYYNKFNEEKRLNSQEAVQTAVPRIAVMQTVRRALRPLMATALSHRQATAVQLMAVHQQALQSLRLQVISFMMSGYTASC